MDTNDRDGAVWKRRVEAAAELLADVGAGECGRLDILTRIRMLKEQTEQLRTAIGANEGEGIIEALHRYTFAVQLGCALKLEQQLRKAGGYDSRPAGPVFAATVAAWKDAIGFLRKDIPMAVSGDAAPRNAVELWKAEQTQAIKDGWIERVLPRFWGEAMGGVPHEPAQTRLRQLLEEHEPGEEAPNSAPLGGAWTRPPDEMLRAGARVTATRAMAGESGPMDGFDAGIRIPMDEDDTSQE